jgi:glycosyltransferase involved in cell wall biosynthesis
MYSVRKQIKQVLVRSEFERKYIIGGFNFNENQCTLVPLVCEEISEQQKPKENFCFHCSLLADKRKSVKRLIQAAKKYNFKLILGGHLRNDQEKQMLKEWIGDAQNIEYLGFLSKEEMHDLYARAKVFALPSTIEGVGIVGLEAASMGCDIVLTSIGGPKEYYNGMVKIVHPLSVDQIGKAVVEFMDGDTYQPGLANHIRSSYSTQNIVSQLVKAYQKLR